MPCAISDCPATADYDRLIESFVPNWPHFKSLAEIHDSHALRGMPFHQMSNGDSLH